MNRQSVGVVVGTIIVLAIGFVAGRMTMNPMFNTLGFELPIGKEKDSKNG